MQPGKSFGSRFKESWNLFFKDFERFKNIFLPYFLYKFFVVIIIGSLFTYFVGVFSNSANNGGFGVFLDTKTLILMNLYIVVIILNVIFIIPFLLGTIKTIKESYQGKKNINYVDNIKYGFKNLLNSFKTYWYIFAYIALTPAILFILGGILGILGYFYQIKLLFIISGILNIISIILFFAYIIYRGIRTSFSLISAVDYDDYTKDNFEKSLKVTDNNWGRIVGNFFLLGLIILIIYLIISIFLSYIELSSSGALDIIKSTILTGNFDMQIIKEYLYNSFGRLTFTGVLIDTIRLFFDVLFFIFVLVFTYIFFKRLELESDVVFNGAKQEKGFEESNYEEKAIEL